MRRSKAVSAFALVAVATLAISACGGGGSTSETDDGTSADAAIAKGQSGEEYTAPEVSSVGQVVVSTDNPFTAYNNQTSDANSSYNTYALAPVLAGAFKLDGNNKVLLNKDVMESVEVTSENPQEVTWKLKSGVTWSDGEAWDCDDFYLDWFTQNAKAKKPDGGDYFAAASTTGYELIDSFTCTDPTTIVTKFSEPYPDYKSLFGIGVDILPAHILEKETGVEDITKVTAASDPALLTKIADFWNLKWNGFDKALMPGSGPYVLTEWVQNTSVTLERNPKWVGKPGGPEKVVIRAVEDPVAQAQALENGETQAMFTPQPDVNAADKLKSLSAQGVTFRASAGLSFEHLDLNFKRIFADKAVRQAFFQCVNRKEIVDKLIGGVQSDATPLGGVAFLNGEEGYTDQYADKSTGSAANAKKTLEAAGWVAGPDGVAVKNGQRLTFKISHTAIPRRKQTVELIQSQCKPAGIEVVDDTDPNFLDVRVSQGDYDVALFAWSSAPFKSSQQSIYSTDGGQNWQGLANPTVDENYKKAVVQTSTEAATQYYQAAEKALAEEFATLPLFVQPNMIGYKGIDRAWMQDYHGGLWNVNEWQTVS